MTPKTNGEKSRPIAGIDGEEEEEEEEEETLGSLSSFFFLRHSL
jgi:hypothetical protein